MMLQRIRSFANWIASDLVSEMSAPFAAVYASWAREKPTSAETEPIRSTEPPPARWSSGIPYFVTQKADLRKYGIPELQRAGGGSVSLMGSVSALVGFSRAQDA